MAWRGWVGRGVVWFGEEPPLGRIGLVVDCYGMSRQGSAGQCLARLGMAWRGRARRGSARMFLLLERV